MDRQERMKIEKEKASHIRYLIDKAETINKAKSNHTQQVNPLIPDGQNKAGRVDRLQSGKRSIESRAAPAENTQTVQEANSSQNLKITEQKK